MDIYKIINSIIYGVGTALSSIIDLLPDSPFSYYLQSWIFKDYLYYAEWILPISDIIATLELWCSCIILYYVYQAVLRWLKMIG